MDITSISQMYQTKLQEINSRIPEQTNIKDKFSSYLENAKLKTVSQENIETTESTNSTTDTNELLSSLLTYNSSLNSTSSLFSSTNSDNSSMFPTMNNSLQVLQQAALLKSLKSNNE